MEMTAIEKENSEALSHSERDSVLRVVSAAAFLILFQSYLVAPLIPALALELHASNRLLGLLVPAYMLPYAAATLLLGPLSDRIGRRPVLLTLLGAMVLTTAGMATAHSAKQLLIWRVLAGFANSGIIPISLALVGDLYPYEQRGRAIGWIFGAIAGGMAFGSTLGAFLNPLIGWRIIFLILGGCAAIVLFAAIRCRDLLGDRPGHHTPSLRAWIDGYLTLVKKPRGWRTYSFILLNGIFHSGIFSWLGLYFSQRHGLGDRGIGLALLGYGVPGMLLGPTLGRIADRFGRGKIIPLGLLTAAVAAAMLMPHEPVLFAGLAVTVLSLGFDMSHPLLAGIITSLDPPRRGQAMGLNAFMLFTGLGFGSLIFQGLLSGGFAWALGWFAAVQTVLAVIATIVFRHEDASAETKDIAAEQQFIASEEPA